MAYRLLSLTAISGEFPTDQLNRLPGSPYYLESVVTALKKDGLLRTYYRDKLRGYRLGPRAKATLLKSRPDRFASYLTGDTDTNRLKCEIDRRLRLGEFSMCRFLCNEAKGNTHIRAGSL